ncbi:unnamed protein product [Paramecium sonneborni]|uniref:Uncharacterized protein n=1 Tax=Paramecium sonneborni TaxID=65129 RepID=A0A8S1LTN1_9CILI|nr:unnamed protein product [Paramecium sonneborni]
MDGVLRHAKKWVYQSRIKQDQKNSQYKNKNFIFLMMRVI